MSKFNFKVGEMYKNDYSIIKITGVESNNILFKEVSIEDEDCFEFAETSTMEPDWLFRSMYAGFFTIYNK